MDINKNKDRARNTDIEVPSNTENLTRGDVARGATGIPNVESTSSSNALKCKGSSFKPRKFNAWRRS
jgi:hypothetical protein